MSDDARAQLYFDMLRAALTRQDPKEFLFFNRNATGKAAARAFVNRLEERTVDRDAPIKINKDEVNVFRRTLLYAGPPNSARWYDMAGPGEKAGARSLIYLRRREGVRTAAFRTFLSDELVPVLVMTGALRELRTQVFLPWSNDSGTRRTWRTTTPPTSGSTPH